MIKFYLTEILPEAKNRYPGLREEIINLFEKLRALWSYLRRCVSIFLPPPIPLPHSIEVEFSSHTSLEESSLER